MKSTSLLMLLGLAASAQVLVIPKANANPLPVIVESNTSPQNPTASQLGNPQEIRGINAALNRPDRELPTFGIESKSQRRKGVLGVLGGRYVKEDRHPSFRKSTLQQ